MDKIRAGPVLLRRANHNVRYSTTKKSPRYLYDERYFSINIARLRVHDRGRRVQVLWLLFAAGPARSVDDVKAAGSSDD
jgi:hypothetical protein